MILDPSTKTELQEGINKIISDEFPWSKEQIIRTRELVPIEDAELWMRYRNAMDRLLSVQRGVNSGEFPSRNLVTEDIEDYTLDDPSSPHDILLYSTYLFRNSGVEAWVQATETLIGLLEIRINSFSYNGDKAKANACLKESLKHQSDARMARSSSHKISVALYKRAAEKAQTGLDLLDVVNPYTRGSFWIGIGILLLALITLFINIWKIYYQT
ncbi:MAG: hypothetical protein OIN66_12170 [Candidatus Methanoperedens sp.]|nr:hypothetical protein [Candidatus Methanoperedens sp.]